MSCPSKSSLVKCGVFVFTKVVQENQLFLLLNLCVQFATHPPSFCSRKYPSNPKDAKNCLQLMGGAANAPRTGIWTSFKPLIRPTEVEFEFTVNGKVDMPNACLVFTERLFAAQRNKLPVGVAFRVFLIKVEYDSHIKVKWCVTCIYTQDLFVYTRKLEQREDQVVFVRCAGRIFKPIYLVVRLRSY